MNLPDLPRAPAWHADALCAQTDPEAFFPEKNYNSAPARAVCRDCPVRDLCLQWALDNDERWGVWGGMSAKQRRALKEDAA